MHFPVCPVGGTVMNPPDENFGGLGQPLLAIGRKIAASLEVSRAFFSSISFSLSLSL